MRVAGGPSRRLAVGDFGSYSAAMTEMRSAGLTCRRHRPARHLGAADRVRLRGGRRSAVATPFVGREAELAALTADLEATLAGRGGVVLLAGEPGIGKTRLAEELATAAAARGALALWGRCWEGEGAPAFWPWVQIIRAHVQAADPAALRQEMGAGAADIAQLVPALRERLPDLPAPPPTEPKA